MKLLIAELICSNHNTSDYITEYRIIGIFENMKQIENNISDIGNIYNSIKSMNFQDRDNYDFIKRLLITELKPGKIYSEIIIEVGGLDINLKEFDIADIRKAKAVSSVLSKNNINGTDGPGGRIMDFLGFNHFGQRVKKLVKKHAPKKKHERSNKKL